MCYIFVKESQVIIPLIITTMKAVQKPAFIFVHRIKPCSDSGISRLLGSSLRKGHAHNVMSVFTFLETKMWTCGQDLSNYKRNFTFL